MKRFLGGALKYGLLLLSAVPLFTIGWRELVRLGQATTVRLTVTYPDDAAQALQKLKATEPTDLIRKAELLGPVVTIAPSAVIGKVEIKQLDLPLAAAVERHSQTVGDTWKFFAEYGRMQRGGTLPEKPPFAENHPYYAPWRERYVTVELETRIVNVRRERPADVQESRQLLDQYRLLPAHDPQFHLLSVADTEGYELRSLQPVDLQALLVKYFKSPNDNEVLLETRNRLQQRLENLESYVRRYEAPDDYVQWARQEAQRCSLTRDLIRTDQASQNLPLDLRLAEFAKFVTATGANGMSSDVVREMVHALCAARLAPELPLEKQLHVLRHDDDPDASSLVARADVIVVWESREFQWLEESGFNEYTLPTERVHRLIVRNQGTRPPLLKPTKGSNAAHTYSSYRRKLEWTPQSLAELKAVCQLHQAELGSVWKQLVELDELVNRYEVLFPSTKLPRESAGGTAMANFIHP